MIQHFHFIKYLDETIDNINLYKNHIYILELERNHYYVGRSNNILSRLYQHFHNQGAYFTQKYKPIKILEIKEEKTEMDETITTLECMLKYGWKQVRGSGWCQTRLMQKPKILEKIENRMNTGTYEINTMEETHWNEDQDNLLVKLYVQNEKNIMEIAELCQRTPGAIAARLVILNLIPERKKARGYFQYINSEIYQEVCSRKKNRKKGRKTENSVKETTNTTDNKVKPSNNKEDIKTEIQEIKMEIKNVTELVKKMYDMMESIYEFENK